MNPTLSLSDPQPGIARPVTARAFLCRCGRPIFFRNSECLACHTPLGYEPARQQLLPLEAVAASLTSVGSGDAGGMAGQAAPAAEAAGALWRQAGAARTAPRYRRCSNLGKAAVCNWLVAERDTGAGQPPLCRCCRLTRTLPDLSVPMHPEYWLRIEQAKRRLVSALIALGLPVQSKAEDPERGLVFDLLRSPPGGPKVLTGHADGVITVDVEEADDAHREARRTRLGEPYRTLLGHLRHESGHYYWQRLVEGSAWAAPFRLLFGDERQDYAAALQKHYADGAPADWGLRHVSAYASSHPWEDWAETWAHYLHMVDTLDTALSFGLDSEQVELQYERFDSQALIDSNAAADSEAPAPAPTPSPTEAPPQGQAQARAEAQSEAPTGGDDPAQKDHNFLSLLNGWMELTGVLNELSRSMGVADFYPFVLSAVAARKLHFVHRLVTAERR